MEEKDREIIIDAGRLYLGEDNILYTTVVGEVDENTAIAIREAHLKFVDMVEGKVDLLIDANKAGQPSSRARKIIQEGVLKYEKTGKVALFGANPVVRVIASFVMGVTRKKDMRFFKTKEEALTWLKK